MAGKKIMVVDDNRLILEITRDILEGAGYRVITRNNPIGTTAAIGEERPDCVMIDVHMPALPGTQVVKFIKEGRMRETRVLLYSDKDEKELRRLAKESGADGFIRKTSDPARLIAHLRTFLPE